MCLAACNLRRTIDRQRTFRSGNAGADTDKRSAVRAPGRRDPINRVLTEVQGEVGSIKERAARLGDDE